MLHTIRKALLPISWLYAAIMKWRRRAYNRGWLKRYSLRVPVVSVGNIRVGGTGKTPIVSAVVAALKAAGMRPAILSRGYRSGLAPKEAGVIHRGMFTPLGQTTLGDGEVAADEARLHSAQHPDVPVIIGADRVAAFRLFGDQGGQADVVVLEDGGQHLKIRRDIDIMLVDWRTTAASIRSLPSGDYREGADALADATAIIVTRCPPDGAPPPGIALWQSFGKPLLFAQFALGAPYLLGPTPSQDQDLGAGGLPPLHLITGIAGPERLKEQLVAAGVTLVAESFFGDHEDLPIEGLTPGGTATARDQAHGSTPAADDGPSANPAATAISQPRGSNPDGTAHGEAPATGGGTDTARATARGSAQASTEACGAGGDAGRVAADAASTEACSAGSDAGSVGWLITEKDLYRQEARFRALAHPVWVVPLTVDMGDDALARILAPVTTFG